jgi:iron complex outermembrane receptor protein
MKEAPMRTRGTTLLAVLAVLLAGPALAQDGKITGKVVDAAGGVLPGVNITVTDQKGATKTTTTAGDGTFSVDAAPGVYTVTADLFGFRKGVAKDVTVAPAASASAEITLTAKLAEEITVTALKRESTVLETPFSIAAPTEADLRSRGIDDIEGVSRDVAGFNIQNLGPGQSQVAMRGVSSGQIARDQPGVKEQVGSYLDESVISLSLFTPDIDLFDMNRVEVLRGPQGTLFGSGSEEGTVRYISNQPELGVTKFFGEFGGNTVSGGNQGGNVKLGFNAPLGDTAAVRIAGYYNRLPGWIDTPARVVTANGSIRPDPSALREDVNTGKRYGVRAALKIAPNKDLSITPRIVYQKVEADGWNRIDDFNILANPFTTTRPAVTLGDRKQFVQIGEPYNDKFVLGDLNISYNFGKTALTSVSSYSHRNIDVIRDAGALTSSITGGSIGLSEPVYSLDAPLDDATPKANTFTQELRLSGTADRLTWLVGGYYAHLKRDYGQDLFVNGFERLTGIPGGGEVAPPDHLFFSQLHYKLDQYAGFGEATYALDDHWSLTAGLRYYHFSEDKQQVFDGIFGQNSDGTPQRLDCLPGQAEDPCHTSAHGVVPRVILTYKVSKDTNINVQASRGFRLGGINDPLNVNLCTPQDLITFGGHTHWEDEKAWNYEAGVKSKVLGNRGSINLSAFYIDVKNLQATVTAGSCSSRVIFNVPKSRSLGGEAEFSVTPDRHFDLVLSAGVHDSKLKSTVTSTAPDGTVSIVSGIEDGNRLPAVAKFQASASATYRWDISGGKIGYLTGSYQHVGDRITQVGDEDLGSLSLVSFGAGTIGAPLTQSTFTFNPVLPAYDVVNARIGLLVGKWDVALYGNNLTDERALLALDRERGLRARVGYLTNQPRTFGISIRFDY